MPVLNPNSLLSRGNTALREGQYVQAMQAYTEALMANADLANLLANNIRWVRQKFNFEQQQAQRLKVAVCGWELSHNAAGRAYALATLYERFADTELIGFLYRQLDEQAKIWEPIRETPLKKQVLWLDDLNLFFETAIQFVASHPYNIIHLSKPRAPNIWLGVLYRLIWGAVVVVDVDDEELAFVDATQAETLPAYLRRNPQLPALSRLLAHDWTRLAVGLAQAFDGVTVANAALQARYGGVVLGHVRDETQLLPSAQRSQRSRLKYGVPLHKKVVLFFGTPRAHKGLLHTAQAIAQLGRADVLFVVVGRFPDLALKQRLCAVAGVDFHFLDNQPFAAIPDVLALADVCVLLQHGNSLAGQFQSPAKLGDALAMGVPVLASSTPALAEVFAAGALIPVDDGCLSQVLGQVLDDPLAFAAYVAAGRAYFERHLSLAANQVLWQPVLHVLLSARSRQVQWSALVQAWGDSRLSALLRVCLGSEESRGKWVC